MTIPVKIEMGGHVLNARMHALPRIGEKLTCSFPASIGPEKFLLVVTGVFHHQTGAPEARDDAEPFLHVITVDGDPTQQAHNDGVMQRAMKGASRA